MCVYMYVYMLMLYVHVWKMCTFMLTLYVHIFAIHMSITCVWVFFFFFWFFKSGFLCVVLAVTTVYILMTNILNIISGIVSICSHLYVYVGWVYIVHTCVHNHRAREGYQVSSSLTRHINCSRPALNLGATSAPHSPLSLEAGNQLAALTVGCLLPIQQPWRCRCVHDCTRLLMW